MTVAEQYVAAFSNLAKKGNTVIIPSSTNDVSGMVAQVSNLLHIILTNDLLIFKIDWITCIFLRLLWY